VFIALLASELGAKGSGMALRAGDWIEIRSKEEILLTLDQNGRLDGLPFMPQMFEYCGQRFRVYKRAHKTCDTVDSTGGRRLSDGIHLENLRCSGKSYGGCEAACLIFWKEAWLKPVGDDAHSHRVQQPDQHRPGQSDVGMGCSEEAILAGTLAKDQPTSGGPRYACQATDLPSFTTHLPWWNVTQYLEDYTSGNVPLSRLISGSVYASYYYLSAPRRRLGPFFQWIYDRFQNVWGGVPFPRRYGALPTNLQTPVVSLKLKPGELVRIKSYKEILETLDTKNKNRGLFFDAEQVPYCGRTYRVRSMVTRFLDEKKGTMTTLKTPAVILENVWCNACYSDRRMNCPRSIYAWWREAWLERVLETTTNQDSQVLGRAAAASGVKPEARTECSAGQWPA
jgi:hypothetical protein